MALSCMHMYTGSRLSPPAFPALPCPGTAAAPEQLLNGRVGLPSDVYSLGLLLHDLCTGEPPALLGGEGRACHRRPLVPGQVREGRVWRQRAHGSGQLEAGPTASRVALAACGIRFCPVGAKQVLCLLLLQDCPQEVAELIGQCLAPAAADRPTAAHVAAALEAFCPSPC